MAGPARLSGVAPRRWGCQSTTFCQRLVVAWPPWTNAGFNLKNYRSLDSLYKCFNGGSCKVQYILHYIQFLKLSHNNQSFEQEEAIKKHLLNHRKILTAM